MPQESAQTGLTRHFATSKQAATRRRHRNHPDGLVPQALMRTNGVVEGFEFPEQVVQVAQSSSAQYNRQARPLPGEWPSAWRWTLR